MPALTKDATQKIAAAEPLTPRQTVAELDRFIVGQSAAKRAVAIAVRNRWRRQQLPAEMRQEVTPKNILMIGPTGVGKTEIARRLAKLTQAPFVKVEATKYTEVGYHGRDVESMVRDLVENAIGIVRIQELANVKRDAEKRTEERLLDLLAPTPQSVDVGGRDADSAEHYQQTRDRMKEMLRSGQLEDRIVEFHVEQKHIPVVFSGIGMEHMDVDIQGMFEKFLPKSNIRREMKVHEARVMLHEQESESLLDQEKINSAAIELAEQNGIIFVDEIDKVVASDSHGADVSRQGVQRDLLPIVEGTTVQTRYGYVRTDHILFIAAGAFHRSKPSDLMPELQGRFPIRVELTELTQEDFVRILTEPQNSITFQYGELMKTEGIDLRFGEAAIASMATFAFQVNQTTQNIGARRLSTIVERVLEDISFDAPDRAKGILLIGEEYVRERLQDIAADEDLSRFIL